jgi:hypothetical protein
MPKLDASFSLNSWNASFTDCQATGSEAIAEIKGPGVQGPGGKKTVEILGGVTMPQTVFTQVGTTTISPFAVWVPKGISRTIGISALVECGDTEPKRYLLAGDVGPVSIAGDTNLSMNLKTTTKPITYRSGNNGGVPDLGLGPLLVVKLNSLPSGCNVPQNTAKILDFAHQDLGFFSLGTEDDSGSGVRVFPVRVNRKYKIRSVCAAPNDLVEIEFTTGGPSSSGEQNLGCQLLAGASYSCQ